MCHCLRELALARPHPLPGPLQPVRDARLAANVEASASAAAPHPAWDNFTGVLEGATASAATGKGKGTGEWKGKGKDKRQDKGHSQGIVAKAKGQDIGKGKAGKGSGKGRGGGQRTALTWMPTQRWPVPNEALRHNFAYLRAFVGGPEWTVIGVVAGYKLHVEDLPQGTVERDVWRWLEQAGGHCTPMCRFGSLTDLNVTTTARSRVAQAFLTFQSVNEAALAFSIAWQWYADVDTEMMCGVAFMRNQY